MDKEELLGEVEDIIRTMPPRPTLSHETDENFAWLGRVSAFVNAWSMLLQRERNLTIASTRDKNCIN
jgi:hypothetical protein